MFTARELEERFGEDAVACAIKGRYQEAEGLLKEGESHEALVYHVKGLIKWDKLSRELRDVPYDLFHEETDTTTPTQDSACSGQSCEVKYL